LDKLISLKTIKKFWRKTVNIEKLFETKVNPNQIEILKKFFPQCFDKRGNFLIEKFKDIIENKTNISKETYSLEWLGKSYARVLANEPVKTLIKEDKEWNKENKNSENLLIKGDNLEVLKHMVNAYYEKIKMIYIDPPYNTGKDGFLYQDDRKFTPKELSKLAGISIEKAKKILDFVNSKSNSHSAWLTFMYPRLYIARELLKDDGVIFVSIDDNELAQLRLLMDEIFGEENFIGIFVRKTGIAPRLDASHLSIEQDYIICFSKNINSLDLNKKLVDINEGYPFKDKYYQKRGKYKLNKLDRGSIKYSSSLDYPIKAPDGSLIYPGGKEKNKWCWRWSKEKVKWGIKNDFIVFKKDKNNEWKVYFKQYQFVDNNDKEIIRTLPFKTLLLDSYNNEIGSKEIEKLFNKKVFSYPKPTNLIKHLLEISTSKYDLILDFFAGSGTTGDAVMQLNAEDGGNRKFILVQLPEPIDPKKNKVAYDFIKDEVGVDNPTIFDVCKERLIRSANKIKEKNLSNLDLGFKIFETIDLPEEYLEDIEELNENISLFYPQIDKNSLLTTWKLYDGAEFIVEPIEIDLDGYKAYLIDKRLYLINENFTTSHLIAMLKKIDEENDFNPSKIVANGYVFDTKTQREIYEAIKNFISKKHIDLEFIIRY